MTQQGVGVVADINERSVSEFSHRNNVVSSQKLIYRRNHLILLCQASISYLLEQLLILDSSFDRSDVDEIKKRT
jgi:hypothetical protein